jgi:cation-transporting P-type ATPase E
MAAPTSGSSGLTEAEAAERLQRRGRTTSRTGRSYASIIWANTFNLPNVVLGIIGAVTLMVGEAADALFLGIVVLNAVLGSVQEIRAKHALERLSALVRPFARVIRSGVERQVAAAEVVESDLVHLQPGDQVVADGTLLSEDHLELDESVLTGESQPVRRSAGEVVRSGAFIVDGSGLATVTAVGSESYAEQIAGTARIFRHSASPFQQGLRRLILALLAVAIPTALLLMAALWIREVPFPQALQAVVAAVAGMVPEGLVLLTSVAYVTGALKMSRRGVLTQQLNALESLASADTLCLDKTGTLTEGRLRLVMLVPAKGTDESKLEALLGRYAASSSVRNATLEAIATALPRPASTTDGQIPFSSRWKWSAIRQDGSTTVIGAPELFPLADLENEASTESAHGRRVLAVAGTTATLEGIDPRQGMPPGLTPLGLAVFGEELRGDADQTVRFFKDQDVELKVISGDAPATVAAIALDVGIPVSAPPLDGRALPTDDAEMTSLVERSSVVGRITPDGKKRVVEGLRNAGRYVGMVGDGVNDVPALKASQVAIAQGSGAQMARTVADMVLVNGEFSAVPRLVGEGRQILRNLQRVSKLYATKCLFTALLTLTIGLAPIAFPLLPRQLTLANLFTTGISATVLALAPSRGPWKMDDYLKQVAGFALRAAMALAIGVGAAYVTATAAGYPLTAARSVATTALVAGFLLIVWVLEAQRRRRAFWVGLFCLGLLLAYLAVTAIPLAQTFFQLDPTPAGLLLGLGGMVVTGLVLAIVGIRPRLGHDEPTTGVG